MNDLARKEEIEKVARWLVRNGWVRNELFFSRPEIPGQVYSLSEAVKAECQAQHGHERGRRLY